MKGDKLFNVTFWTVDAHILLKRIILVSQQTEVK